MGISQKLYKSLTVQVLTLKSIVAILGMNIIDSTSPNVRLLQQVLEASDALGIDQTRLATQAGLQPETISRAKKRGDIKLSTLVRLAAVVGLEVALQPSNKHVMPSSLAPIDITNTPPLDRAPLSHPRFGLAWSNRNAKEDVLLRNALLQGRFNAILESAVQDGIPFVRAQMQNLRESGDMNEEVEGKLERMVKSIERGFAISAADMAVNVVGDSHVPS